MPYLSKDQIRQIIQSRPQGTTPEGIVATLRQNGNQLEGYDEAPTSEPGFLGRIQNRITDAGMGVRSALDDYQTGKQGSLDTVLQSAGNIFSGIVSPITETTSTVMGGAIKATGLDKPLAQGIQNLAASPIGKKAQDLYQQAERVAPQQLKTFKSVGKAVLDAADVYGTGKAVQGATKLGTAVAKKTTGIVQNAMAKDFDEVIATGMAKGVKPQFRGAMRTSANALLEYNKKASEAVRRIIDNTDTLQYVDEAGEVISQGHAPRNLAEFAQAVDQTKRRIFEEYSALTQQASGQGIIVDLDDIVDKLIDYADNPVKQLADKSKTEYALRMAEQLMKQKKLSPVQVEELVKELNQGLAKTYADKIAKGASEVDLSIANALREKLDDAVLLGTGKKYQPLKNAYGALKTIEKDVGHRALIVARGNVKGLSDLTDIFTGGDLIAGALTGNPALLVRGAAGKGIQAFYKNLTSPDANIMRMFNRAERVLKQASTLTPEEKITGLIGGGSDNLPRISDESLASVSSGGESALGNISLDDYEKLRAAEKADVVAGIDPKKALEVERAKFLRKKK